MELSLAGKHAVVGGASRGIGRAAAIELAANGASITLIARDQERLQRAMSELDINQDQQHAIVMGDSGEPDEIAAKLNEIVARRPVNIVVNNTGGPPGGPLSRASTDELVSAFTQHVLFFQAVLQVVLPGMRESGYGRIINVISTSVKQPIPGLGVSNTIRGAVANWAKTLAQELGPDGITVNNILPGFTKTDRLDSILDSGVEKSGLDRAEIAKSLKESVPLRRFGRAEETAAAIAFLASPAAGYISGINLPVDGGRTGSL